MLCGVDRIQSRDVATLELADWQIEEKKHPAMASCLGRRVSELVIEQDEDDLPGTICQVLSIEY